MNLNGTIRAYRLSGLYILLIAVPLRGDCLTLRAVFDVLFPSTPFKRLLIHASQLHGMFDSLNKQSDIHDKKWVQEVIECSLVAFEHSVDAMANERIKCRAQDLEYLLIVLDKVVLRAHEVFKNMHNNECVVCIQKVIAIQEKIDQLL